MSHAVPVALVGFSRFERATFESFFRLAANRQPAYRLAERLQDCEAAIVNADDEAGVAEVGAAGRLDRALMLGGTPRPGAATQLPRPINLMLVVRALDQVVNGRAEANPEVARAPVASPAPATPARTGTQRVLDDLATITGVVPAGVDPRAIAAGAVVAPRAQPAAAPVADPLSLLQPSGGNTDLAPPALPPRALGTPRRAGDTGPATIPDAPRERRSTLDHILVVDDSDIALRFMAQHLQRFGFEVHLARSGAEAIERVSKRHFELVFLDVMMEGLDGFHTCKAIKRATYPDHRPPPTVVMLTSRGSAVDKLRGTMAGADAYLTKPLREAELLKVVGDREIERHAYVDTAAAASTLL